MTELSPVPRTSTTLSRRIAWFAIACAAASLALTIVGKIGGNATRWTAWVLPVLIVANVMVLFFGGRIRRPWLLRGYVILSLGLAAAIIASEALALMRR